MIATPVFKALRDGRFVCFDPAAGSYTVVDREHVPPLVRLGQGTFDEAKHPRGQPENAGEFGPGGGGAQNGAANSAPPTKPSAIKYDTPAAFADSIGAAYQAGGHDSAGVRAVAASLPHSVVARLSKGRLNSVHVHPDVNALTESFYNGDPALKAEKKRQRTLGFYDGSTGSLESDGGPDPAGTFAHEIGHAIDNELGQGGPFGLSNALSEDDDFMHHWEKEIKATRKLSAYACTEPAEGFAEFTRLLYGTGPQGKTTAAKDFPGTFAFFKKNGLV